MRRREPTCRPYRCPTIFERCNNGLSFAHHGYRRAEPRIESYFGRLVAFKGIGEQQGKVNVLTTQNFVPQIPVQKTIETQRSSCFLSPWCRSRCDGWRKTRERFRTDTKSCLSLATGTGEQCPVWKPFVQT